MISFLYTTILILFLGSSWKYVSLPVNSTNHVVKNLVPATTYRFQLAAVLGSGQLSCSDFKKAKTYGWGDKRKCASLPKYTASTGFETHIAKFVASLFP